MNENYRINGEEKTFLEWCGEYQASALQVRALMSLGVPLEEALQSNAHRRIVLISMNGQTKSLSDWCAQYGVSPSAVKKRITSGYTLQESFEAKKYGTHKIKTAFKKQESDYTITKPFLEWCRDYAADPLYIRAGMSTGYSIKYILREAPRKRIKQLVMRVEDNTDTFLHLCRKYKKASNTIRRRIAFGLTLEDAFLLPAFKKGEIERLLEAGKANEEHSITKPFQEWCRDYNLPQRVVEQRLALGMSFEQAMAPERPGNLEINGRQVTLSDLCGNLGLNSQSVKERMAGGMSILEAINETAIRRIGERFPIDGKLLKEARENAGISQSQLAEMINNYSDFRFTKYVIHALENGKRLISRAEWQTLKESLQIPSFDKENVAGS